MLLIKRGCLRGKLNILVSQHVYSQNLKPESAVFLWCKSFFHLVIFTFLSLAPSPSPSRFPQSHLFWTDLPKYCLKYLAHMCHSRTTKGSYCILCTVFTLFLRCKWHHCMFSADCCSLVILVFTLY